MVDTPAPRDGARVGPTPMRGRSIAPDLARGTMLALIAVANASWFLWAAEGEVEGVQAGYASTADWTVWAMSTVAVAGRVYPMFAFLFGYGIVQLYRRQTDAGVSAQEARRLLRRRHWWLVVFGAVHAALLWDGDILGAYGLVGLLLVWLFLDRRDRTVGLWLLGLTAVLIAAVARSSVLSWRVGPTPLISLPTPEGVEDLNSVSDPDIVVALVKRIAEWGLDGTVHTVFGLVVPIAMLFGMSAARRQVLENPADHRGLLKWTALIGLTVAWGSGLLVALVGFQGWGGDGGYDLVSIPAFYLGGLAGGLGYVALFGLIAERLERVHDARGTTGRWSGALQALGKRSLSGYLAQSLILAPLLSAWGLGLGSQLSIWSVVVVALAVWGATLWVATIHERAGRRGPAEQLLRRLTYPSSTS
ncbi:DUF418 domain-containing protein [Millisia brevis]|uniref:DUF418 domain-containing protein n=1 Tax=Millisia brevis TaxID=264148 RepID=UPI000A0100ED|nr:DUF418 domain-containing protein [Millisia brevis]